MQRSFLRSLKGFAPGDKPSEPQNVLPAGIEAAFLSLMQK
jgi:hypothetical protein